MTANCVLTLICGALMLLASFPRAGWSAERKETRVLYDFEDGNELTGLRAHAENVTFELSQDNGITRGKNSCRMIAKPSGNAMDTPAAGLCEPWRQKVAEFLTALQK